MGRRKITDYVQTGLRVREELLLRLKAAAKKNMTPLNKEMQNRLERSLDADAMKTIEEAATDISKTLSRVRRQLESA